MNSLTIKELWEVVNGEGRAFRLEELTELVFNAPHSDQEMALFRALADDRFYFKQKGELYEAREPEKVEQLYLQQEREAEQEREMQEAGAWLAGVWSGEMAPPPENISTLVRLLKDMALFGSEAPEYAKGKALLERAKISSPQAPFELLVKMREWGEDENLFLYRYQISKVFPESVIDEAGKILSLADKDFPFIPRTAI